MLFRVEPQRLIRDRRRENRKQFASLTDMLKVAVTFANNKLTNALTLLRVVDTPPVQVKEKPVRRRRVASIKVSKHEEEDTKQEVKKRPSVLSKAIFTSFSPFRRLKHAGSAFVCWYSLAF